MQKGLRAWWKRLIHGKWKVVRTGWPYPDGWGTYRPRDRTVLDTGLKTREDAQALVDQLNRYEA